MIGPEKETKRIGEEGCGRSFQHPVMEKLIAHRSKWYTQAPDDPEGAADWEGNALGNRQMRQIRRKGCWQPGSGTIGRHGWVSECRDIAST